MPDLYEPGEFALADKLLPTEHRAGRLATLQKLYQTDPALAREVISYAWPNERHRPYTDEELRARLAIQEQAARATKVGAELFEDLFPSVSAAYNAYEFERARQAALDAQNFPALNFTQPTMASYALGGGGQAQDPVASAPPVHHRRHYHRHHKMAEATSPFEVKLPDDYPDRLRALDIPWSSMTPDTDYHVVHLDNIDQAMLHKRNIILGMMGGGLVGGLGGRALHRKAKLPGLLLGGVLGGALGGRVPVRKAMLYEADKYTGGRPLYGKKQAEDRSERAKIEKMWARLSDAQRETIKTDARKILATSETPDLDAALAARLLRETPHAHEVHDQWAVMGGGGWSAKDQRVYFTPEASRHPAVVSHELGHADVEQHPWQRWSQSTPANVAWMMGPLSGLYAGSLSPRGIGTVLGPLAWTALTQGPKAYSERKAWEYGRKQFEATHPTEAQRANFEKTRANALGTYNNVAAATLGISLLGAGARAALEGHLRRRGQWR